MMPFALLLSMRLTIHFLRNSRLSLCQSFVETMVRHCRTFGKAGCICLFGLEFGIAGPVSTLKLTP